MSLIERIKSLIGNSGDYNSSDVPAGDTGVDSPDSSDSSDSGSDD